MNINIKNKKVILAAIGAGVLLVAVCVILFMFSGNDEAYRSIRLYRIEGTATVERDGLGMVDAYVGMMLRSGDIVHTGKDSFLYFKLDEDKYALLEAESTVRIEASGTNADSRTVLQLETGSLVSRLDSKLSPDSVYGVNTPNSTMAVRGTVFRIEILWAENGDSYTNVYVFEGTVDCQLLFPDGRKDDAVKPAEGGMRMRIRGDDTISEYITDDGTVDYGELPAEVLEFLKMAVEEGVDLPVSAEELDALLAGGEKEEPHEHSGGTATCIGPAVCATENCGQTYGEADPDNHTGGTELRGEVPATCGATGYAGDTYCLGCGVKTAGGGELPKLTTHTGGTEVRDRNAATCCNTGYTGDTYCKTCGVKTETGTSIAATGNHAAAVCGADGHHVHDGKVHASAPCGIAGHCSSDGLDHGIAPCLFISHYRCDGKIHNDLCYDAGYFNVEVVVTDNGGDWSFTLNGTVYDKSDGSQDGEQYYFRFQGSAGDTITVSRTGTTGEFYAVSEVMDQIFGTTALEFLLVEGNEEYMITVVIE